MKIYYVEKSGWSGLEYSSPYYSNKEAAVDFFNEALKAEIRDKENIRVCGEWKKEEEAEYSWSNRLNNLLLRSEEVVDKFHFLDLPGLPSD